jgi:hypothetical protein
MFQRRHGQQAQRVGGKRGALLRPGGKKTVGVERRIAHQQPHICLIFVGAESGAVKKREQRAGNGAKVAACG